MITTYRAPTVAALGFIGFLVTIGCEVTYPDGKYSCGNDSICPKGLYCHRSDSRCWREKETAASGGKGEEVSGSGAIEDVSGIGGQGGTSRTADSAGIGGGSKDNGNGAGGAGGFAGVGNTARAGRGGVGFTGSTGGRGVEPTGGTGGNGGQSGSGTGGAGGSVIVGNFETVTDTATGLTWQRCLAGQSGENCEAGVASSYAWQQAIEYCDALVFAGHDDWRLPSVNELSTLVDYSTSIPSINSDMFPNTPTTLNDRGLGYFWASTEFARDAGYAWDVGFYAGDLSWRSKDDANPYARCVRGNPLAIGQWSREVVSGDPVVRDAATALTWQGCSAGQEGSDCSGGASTFSTPQAAEAYCEALTIAGYNDWRLPNIHELVSIVDYTKDNPAIDRGIFPSTSASLNEYTWSSTPVVGSFPGFSVNSAATWYVGFNGGFVNCQLGNPIYVRCVRTGI